MSFLDHLDELRKRLIACVYGRSSRLCGRFFFVERIQAFIWLPLYREMQTVSGAKFMYTQGFEPFMLMMKIGALAGLFVVAAVHHLAAVAVHRARVCTRTKRSWRFRSSSSGTVFFVIGAAFSHYVAFPWTWKFFLGWETEYMEFRPTIAEAFGL